MTDTRSAGVSRVHRISLAFLAVGGIFVPVFFGALVIVAAAGTPGYSHVTQFMSQLGVGPRAALANADFAITGLLLIAFAVGLHRGIGDGRAARLGPGLVALSGLGWCLVGAFPCSERTCTAIDVHNAVAAPVVFVSIALAPVMLFRPLMNDVRWHRYAAYSRGTGLALLVMMVAYTATEHTLLKPWVGIAQRVLVGVMLLWVEVMALHLL